LKVSAICLKVTLLIISNNLSTRAGKQPLSQNFNAVQKIRAEHSDLILHEQAVGL